MEVYNLPVLIAALIYITCVQGLSECRSGCYGSPSGIFKYEAGSNYIYELEGRTVTTLAGAANDVARIGIKALVDVSALPECNYVMRISKLVIIGPDGKKHEGGSDLIGKPVRFNMHNGRAEPAICKEEGEPENALNIKRAVVSLLQTHQHSEGFSTKHETDVFGVCPTLFEVSSPDGKLKVVKTRNLNSCAHREDIKLPFITTPYKSESEFQAAPILDAHLTVQQQFEEGLLKTTTSEEVYKYQPVGGNEAGATVLVRNKLTLVSQNKGYPISDNAAQSESIIFQMKHSSETSVSLATLTEALKKVTENADPGVKEDGARNFAALVKIIAQADKQTAIDLFNKVKEGAGFPNKEVAKKIFLDAIVRSESSVGVEIMAELLKKREVTGLQAKMWLLNFGFVKHASKGVLKAVIPLLNEENISDQAYLGIGMLVGKYCQEHQCDSVQEVADLENNYLSNPLSQSCKPTNFVQENTLIASMKGLGNTHFLTPEVKKKLTECAKDKSVKMRVRVAALEALRTDPNHEHTKTVVGELLQDLDEDSEIRIKSYLVLVECPCGKTAALIKQVLANEKVHQVGSFIVSHLRNIRSSTNPDKQKAKHHFGGIYAPDKYKFDVRKFSQNYEMSYAADNVNVGASGEANVIFSQRSYVPRSVSLNVSTHLFGHSFNLFELGARTENLDLAIERMFGPRGYLKKTSPNDVLYDGTVKFNDFTNKVTNAMRPRRSASPDQMDDMYKKVNMDFDVLHDDFLMDLSVKMYGSEIGWFKYHGEDLNPDSTVDNIVSGFDFSINNAKKLDIDYTKHTTFMDGEIIYPTGMGLPLKLKTIGSSALRVKMLGKVDAPAIVRDPLNTDVKVHLVPSASIELSGFITVDSGLLETGVKMALNIHSSTGVEMDFRVLGGSGVDVKIGLPLKKQEVVTAKTEVLSFIREKEVVTAVPVKFDINKEEYSGCFDQLNSLIGLTFCGEVSIPWERERTLSPFYGPAKFSLQIEVEDQALTNYHFRTYFTKQTERKGQKFEILLDTPGSSTNRKINFVYETGTTPNGFLNLKLTTPWKDYRYEGETIVTKKEISLRSLIEHDGDEYSFKLGVNLVSSSENKGVYEPFLDYKMPVEPSKLIGRRGGPKSTHALSVSGSLTIETEPDVGTRTYTFNDFALHTQRSKYTLDGKFVAKHPNKETCSMGADLKLMYDSENVIIKSEIQREGNRKLDGYFQVIPSQYPDLAINTIGKIETTKGEDFKFAVEFDLIHGPDPDSKSARFTMTHHILVSGIKKDNIDMFAVKNLVSYPLVGVHAKADLEWVPGNFKFIADGQIDQQTIETKLIASVEPKGSYDIDLSAKFLDNGFGLVAKREIVNDHKSKFTNSLEIYPGKLYQLNSLVKHKFLNNDWDFHVDLDFKTPGEPKHIKSKFGMFSNNNKLTSEVYLKVDNKEHVDFSLVHSKNKNPKGQFKLMMPEYVESKGKYKIEENQFAGDAYVLLLKIERKIELKGDLSTQPKCTGKIEFCWDTSDRTKTVIVSTDTDVQSNSIETKNVLQYGTYKTQLNFKGKCTGDKKTGTTHAEAEIILPESQHHFSGKYSRSFNMQPGDSEMEHIIELSHKSGEVAQPRKLSLKFVGKHMDFNKGQVDGQVTVAYSNPQGGDLNVYLAHKKLPNEDKWTVNCQLDVTGSLILRPIKLKFDSELSERLLEGNYMNFHRSLPAASFHLQASLGQDASIDSHGKMGGHTITGEVLVSLPNNKDIKEFKWTTSNVFETDPEVEFKMFKIKINNGFSWDKNFFKVNKAFTYSEDSGSATVSWETNDVKKRTLYITSRWPKEKSEVMNFELAMKYDWEGKPADFTLNYQLDMKQKIGTILLKGNCTINGKFDSKVVYKVLPYPLKGMQVTWSNTYYGGETVKGLYKVVTLDNHPVMEFYVEDSNGKTGFMIKGDKKGLAHTTGELHLQWAYYGGGELRSQSEMILKSIDDFFFKVIVNSEQFKLKDYTMEVASLEKGTKKIKFDVKNDQKVILTGSAAYEFNRKKDGNYYIEGSGQILVDNELRPVTVQTVWRPAINDKIFNVTVTSGDIKLDLQSIITPTSTYFVRKFCSPKIAAKCSEAKIISSAVKADLKQQEHNVEIVIDFSLFDPSYNDFSFKLHTKREMMFIDQTMEIQWSPTDKFKYEAFINERKSGITLALPKRTIAGELSYDFPATFGQGRFKVEGSFWLDKLRKPENKANFLAQFERNQDKESTAVMGEVKFSHPSLSKDFLVKLKSTITDSILVSQHRWDGQFELDLFKETDQKIVTTWKIGQNLEKGTASSHELVTIKSKGLGIDNGYEKRTAMTKSSFNHMHTIYVTIDGVKKDSTFKTELTDKKFHVIFKTSDKVLYEVNYKIEKFDNRIILSGLYDLAGYKYKESIEINNHNNLIYTFDFGKATDERKVLKLDMGYALGQIAEIKADLNKKPIFQLEVALDEANFLRSKYIYDMETLKQLYITSQNQVSRILESYETEFTKILEEETSNFGNVIKKVGSALPDVSPLAESYLEELEMIREEILSDEMLQKALVPVKKMLSSTIERLVVIIEEANRFITSTIELLKELTFKMDAAIRELSKKLAEVIKDVVKSLLDLFEEWFALSVQFLDIIINEINKHENDIKAIFSALSDIIHDLGKLVAKLAVQIQKEFEEFVRLNMEQIRELPIFEIIKEKFEELKMYTIPEEVWSDFHEFVSSIVDSAPNPELKKFITTITTYFERLLKREPINTNEALKEIYSEFIAALRPTFDMIQAAISPDENVFDKAFLIPLPAFTLWKLPGGSMRFSGIPWILSPDLPSAIDVFLTYVSFNLDDWMPPYQGKAVIVGSEIITFDGRHVTLKGACSYLLAQDFVNNNFSVVANMKNNKLKSIQLFSGSDFVELKADGKVYFNGKQHEYPVIEKEGMLVAWRHPDSVGLRAGTVSEVLVHCKSDISACLLQVSGFYFGKMRGAFGNLNYEPYDDFLLPSGKIASKEPEFVNGWVVEGQCQPLPVHDVKHVHYSKCAELFSDSDQFQFCFRVLDPKPYRTMCDHLAQSGHEDAQCTAALAYASLCQYKFPSVSLPQQCNKCTIDGKTMNKDEIITYKTPGKLADVIFLVELLEENEEVYKSLISPLVNSLTNELQSRGISDISFALVGFGAPRSKWPTYFTKDGKIHFDGKISHIFFDKAPKYPNTTFIDRLLINKKQMDIELDKTQRAVVFNDIIKNYRFRPGAIKSIIAVHANPCEESNFILGISKVIHFQRIVELKTAGIVYNLISPVHNLALQGKDAKEIIGCSKEEVYMLSDADSKPLKGSTDAMESVSHTYDVCHNFAHDSGGSVFVSNNFIEGKPEFRVKFMKAATTRIADTMTSQEQTVECQCVLHRGLIPKTVCYVVDSKPITP